MAYGRRAPYDYYAVVEGLESGIYSQWEGGNGARARVDGYSNAVHKGFYALHEAIEWYKEMTGGQEPVKWYEQSPYKYYAVTEGKHPGIYDQWFGDGAYSQITGYHRSCFKGFHDLEEAKAWFKKENGHDPELKLSNEQE